jgi:hypothetical protein
MIWPADFRCASYGLFQQDSAFRYSSIFHLLINKLSALYRCNEKVEDVLFLKTFSTLLAQSTGVNPSGETRKLAHSGSVDVLLHNSTHSDQGALELHSQRCPSEMDQGITVGYAKLFYFFGRFKIMSLRTVRRLRLRFFTTFDFPSLFQVGQFTVSQSWVQSR